MCHLMVIFGNIDNKTFSMIIYKKMSAKFTLQASRSYRICFVTMDSRCEAQLRPSTPRSYGKLGS